jgi:hypothetical protein
MSTTFSERHGYAAPDAEIVVREDAPEALRYAVAECARSAGLAPSSIRDIACRILLEPPDRNNWSEYPNIWEEVLWMLRNCEWYKVYDIAEAIWRSFEYRPDEQRMFEDEINRCFREKGIGWELKRPDGIVYRGSETFAAVTREAAQTLSQTGHSTAANEIHEALRDISRRPVPDRTGAIQHAMAALECTAREVTGQKDTLGRLLPGLNLPKPLDTAVEKLWGFASERARHLHEGNQVSSEEAELVVIVACAVSNFLVNRDKQ